MNYLLLVLNLKLKSQNLFNFFSRCFGDLNGLVMSDYPGPGYFLKLFMSRGWGCSIKLKHCMIPSGLLTAILSDASLSFIVLISVLTLGKAASLRASSS